MKEENIFGGGMVIGAIIASVVWISVMGFKPQSTIIKHGCAEYNKTTGDFQWVKKD